MKKSDNNKKSPSLGWARFLILVMTGVLLISACTPQPTVDPNEPVPGLGQTFAAYTMQAQLTQWSVATMEAQITQLASEVAAAATLQSEPTAELQATPVFTPLPAGAKGTKCNWAEFVGDVTIPDGTVIEPNAKFVKTWRLKNIGTCTWTTKTAFIFAGSAQLGAASQVMLSRDVKPGDTIDVSVSMTAPAVKEAYTGFWQLKAENGETFGIGAEGKGTMWVKITVDELTRRAGSNIAYDLGNNTCSASWETKSGPITCPNIDNFSTGSVSQNNAPTIEGSVRKTLPTIVMIPSDGEGGYIMGIFPPFQVNAGDHFRSTIGCLDGNRGCDVDFELYGVVDGKETLLGKWGHTMDAYVDEVDADLSQFAGSAVQMKLVVRNNGSSAEDRAFWMWPNIWR